MTQRGSESERMIITVDTQTGKIVEPPVDEKGNEATPVDPKDRARIFQSPDELKYLGTILHVHSSPGCVIIMIGDRPYKICF